MELTRLTVLIDRAMSGTLTSMETDELLAYLADPQNKQRAEGLLAAAWERFAPRQAVFTDTEGEEMLRQILNGGRIAEPPEAAKEIWYRKGYKILAAASVVMAIMTAIYFLTRSTPNTDMTLAEAVAHYQIMPGTSQATITLGDGRTVMLDETTRGIIAEEAGMRIVRSDDGHISYERLSNGPTPQTAYNTVTTPKGGHSRLILPDGTKVHLNSQSVLRYPVQFAASERTVMLDGEAYFEVARQAEATGKALSFVVETPTQEVEVLGTTFNINAYRETSTKTTLVEGKVRVSSADAGSVLLQPGESALLEGKDKRFVIAKANLDLELAWHHGYFIFDNEPIEHIMERVARWYDVEVEYQGNMEAKQFGGIFQRTKSITQLLESFKATGLVDFQVTERRVIVMGK